MPTDEIRKYILSNIPYLFIGWGYLKLGMAYRLAAGAGFGEKFLGQTCSAPCGGSTPRNRRSWHRPVQP